MAYTSSEDFFKKTSIKISIIHPNEENMDLYLAWRLWVWTATYK